MYMSLIQIHPRHPRPETRAPSHTHTHTHTLHTHTHTHSASYDLQMNVVGAADNAASEEKGVAREVKLADAAFREVYAGPAQSFRMAPLARDLVCFPRARAGCPGTGRRVEPGIVIVLPDLASRWHECGRGWGNQVFRHGACSARESLPACHECRV